MGLTLEQVDAELSRWRDRLAAASRNVSELSELPEYIAARNAASGSGRMATEARQLVATMDELWQGVLLIGAALDRAEQARKGASRLWGSDDAAARAWDVLHGDSIEVDLAATPVLHRRLLAGPRAMAIVSPGKLLETMDGAFDRARERLARITDSAGRAEALRTTLADAIARLPAPAGLAAELAATHRPDPLDRLDALEALRPRIDATVAADAGARTTLADARQDLAVLEHAMARMQANVDACRATIATDQTAHRAYVDPNALRELAGWLDRIHRTLQAGRPDACVAGLASWRALHDQTAATVRAEFEQASAMLARRDELRARLGALRVKRRARANVGPDLERLEVAAKAAVMREPIDLDAASAALGAFQATLAGS